MAAHDKTDPPAGFDDRAYYTLAGVLIEQLGSATRVPADVVAGLTRDRVRVLTDGLERALAGEAASDAFLRFLSRGPRGRTDVADDARLPETEVTAVRDRGAGAAALATLVAAATTPDHFVTLLSAADLAPYWEDRRRVLFGGPGASSAPRPPVPSSTPAVDPATDPEPVPPSAVAGVSGECLNRAVQRHLYRVLTGESRSSVQTGLDRLDPSARRALARLSAVAMWTSDDLDAPTARAHYAAAAAAIRAVLVGWAHARADGLPLKDTPWIESASGVSLVFPKGDGPAEVDWVAADALYQTAAAADPAAAEAFALHLYAGMSYGYIAAVTGRPVAAVAAACRPLLDALPARPGVAVH